MSAVRIAPAIAALQLLGGTSASPAVAQTDGRQIHVDGDTGCAFGMPFSFFYRPGTDSTRLLIWFEGGGACWDPVSCSGLFDSTVNDDELITITDSGVPLLPGYPTGLEQWGAGPVLRSAWDAPADTPLTLERAWHEAARLPRMRAVVAVMSDQDRIQSAFYLVAGSPAWREDSYALLDRVEHADTNVHSFVVAGADHGLLRTDAFYRYEADRTPLVAWIRRLLEGAPVTNVRCAGCVNTR
jgi:hypothetical protein